MWHHSLQTGPSPTPNYHMTAHSRRNMALSFRGTAHHASVTGKMSLLLCGSEEPWRLSYTITWLDVMASFPCVWIYWWRNSYSVLTVHTSYFLHLMNNTKVYKCKKYAGMQIGAGIEPPTLRSPPELQPRLESRNPVIVKTNLKKPASSSLRNGLMWL